VTDFLDLAVQSNKQIDLQMEEFELEPDSWLVGRDILSSNIRPRYNVIIVAIKKPGGDMVFNPQPDIVLEARDILVVVGSPSSLDTLKGLVSAARSLD
jgi:voltage-gated potassium channel